MAFIPDKFFTRHSSDIVYRVRENQELLTLHYESDVLQIAKVYDENLIADTMADKNITPISQAAYIRFCDRKMNWANLQPLINPNDDSN
jgi:hypothetical protein